MLASLALAMAPAVQADVCYTCYLDCGPLRLCDETNYGDYCVCTMKGWVIGILVIAGVLKVSFIVFCCWYTRKKRNEKQAQELHVTAGYITTEPQQVRAHNAAAYRQVLITIIKVSATIAT